MGTPNMSAILFLANSFTAGNDLTGAKVTRIRTMAKFVDAANFSGATNPFGTPDPNAEFADVDAQGLKQIGEGLQGIANFLEAMDGANLKSVSKSLSQLTEQLQKYQEQYSKMDTEAKANLVSNFSAFGEGQKGAADKLDQLNSSVLQMLVELRKQTRSGSNIEANLV